MNSLLTQMEAELNSIPDQKIKILNDVTITQERRAEMLERLEWRRDMLKKIIANYISVQNTFMELQGMFSLNY